MIKNDVTGLLEIKDQSLNILLLTIGHKVAERIRGAGDRKMYLCYEDTPKIREDVERWQSNNPFPIKDARAFFLGTEIYYSNLHAHLDEAK